MTTADREIVITRVFDAPRELTWQAMTDPNHVVQWWGPNGFTTTIQEMDFRRGGRWTLVMHGPDGTDYPNHSTFQEIIYPERIVYTHGGAKAGGPEAAGDHGGEGHRWTDRCQYLSLDRDWAGIGVRGSVVDGTRRPAAGGG